MIKTATTHIFTIPEPLKNIPVTVSFTQGEGVEQFKERVEQIFNSEEFNKLGLVKDGKFNVPIVFQSVVYANNPINYPKEFSEQLNVGEQALVKKLFDDFRGGARYPVVNGGLGDIENCDAIVEKRITPETGGDFTKFWGCNYLFKSFPEKNLVEGLGFGKAFLSIFPRKILADSLVFKLAIGFMLIFRRTKLLHYGHIISYQLYTSFVKRFEIPKEKYNMPVKELCRATDASLKYMLEDEGLISDRPLTDGYLIVQSRFERKRLLWRIIACLAEFVYIFLENDTAYRFRLQDILENVSKVNIRKSLIGEVQRLINLMIARESEVHGIRDKLETAGKIIIFALRVSKRLRRFIFVFLLELDNNKVKLDEDDWYFVLRRRGYDYGGKTLAERMEEARKLDIDKGNISMQLTMLKDEKSNTNFPALKIVKL